MVCWMMHSASCRERSASARMCELAPLRMILHASPLLRPLNRMTLLSPITISSMRSHLPRPTRQGLSFHALEVGVLDGHHTGLCEHLLGQVVDELT